MTKYLIIKDKTIHHEGDERSRNYPGHGYPAWSETVQEVSEFGSEEAMQAHVETLVGRGVKFRLFEVNEMRVSIKTELQYTK